MKPESSDGIIRYLTGHKAIRFCVIGGAAFLIDVACAWGLLHVLPKLPALSLAYFFSCLFHYLSSKHWTFRDRSRVSARQVRAYALVNILTLVINTALAAWLLKRFDGNVVLAKAIALPPTSVLGYCLLRSLVFRPAVQPAQG